MAEVNRCRPLNARASKASWQFSATTRLPATALSLAVLHGLVPPAPYWPERGRVKAKDKYRAALLAIATRDPQRAEEFRRAAKV